jgi:tRNA-dihydrouridine synthase 1
MICETDGLPVGDPMRSVRMVATSMDDVTVGPHQAQPQPESEPVYNAQPVVACRRAAHGRRCHELWATTFGGSRYVCAPMVLQSECAFRMLVRQYGCGVCWAPMAKATYPWPTTFSDRVIDDLRRGGAADRPLVAQLSASQVPELLSAARLVAQHCDAIDLNLGCPQTTAEKEGFGAFMMDKPDVVAAMVRAMVADAAVTVPVFVKIRVFPERAATLSFVQMLEGAGASLITVHGRTRDNTVHRGPCDWETIGACVGAVRIPVIANGHIYSMADAERCLATTGCVAVMGAGGLLYDHRMFGPDLDTHPRDPIALAREYLGYAARYAAQAREIRDHLLVMLREEIQLAGYGLQNMFLKQAKHVNCAGQFCALVSREQLSRSFCSVMCSLQQPYH